MRAHHLDACVRFAIRHHAGLDLFFAEQLTPSCTSAGSSAPARRPSTTSPRRPPS
jgi:hypothetical protein